jgi:hypothetical protein
MEASLTNFSVSLFFQGLGATSAITGKNPLLRAN